MTSLSKDTDPELPCFSLGARLLLSLVLIWASPWTLFGLVFGCLGLISGGQMRRVGRVLEFSGGWIAPLLRCAPFLGGASAITFGHAVLAVNQLALDVSRSHERVHVHQYERWGLLFVPAYLLSGLYVWVTGRNPYFDNPFEREAYRKAE